LRNKQNTNYLCFSFTPKTGTELLKTVVPQKTDNELCSAYVIVESLGLARANGAAAVEEHLDEGAEDVAPPEAVGDLVGLDVVDLVVLQRDLFGVVGLLVELPGLGRGGGGGGLHGDRAGRAGARGRLGLVHRAGPPLGLRRDRVRERQRGQESGQQHHCRQGAAQNAAMIHSGKHKEKYIFLFF